MCKKFKINGETAINWEFFHIYSSQETPYMFCFVGLNFKLWSAKNDAIYALFSGLLILVRVKDLTFSNSECMYSSIFRLVLLLYSIWCCIRYMQFSGIPLSGLVFPGEAVGSQRPSGVDLQHSHNWWRAALPSWWWWWWWLSSSTIFLTLWFVYESAWKF